MNMCSKCFREYRRSNPQEQQQTVASESNLTVPSVESPQRTLPVQVNPPSPQQSIPASIPESPSTVAKEETSELCVPGSSSIPMGTKDVSDPPPRKVQKNTSRCFSCRKKIGLTGFKCYCGYFFCSEHRYSDKHDCDYDYQASQREQLSKANPIVVASKLEKI